MAIKLGSTDINSVNLGSVGLNRIYSGSDFVFGGSAPFYEVQFDGVNDNINVPALSNLASKTIRIVLTFTTLEEEFLTITVNNRSLGATFNSVRGGALVDLAVTTETKSGIDQTSYNVASGTYLNGDLLDIIITTDINEDINSLTVNDVVMATGSTESRADLATNLSHRLGVRVFSPSFQYSGRMRYYEVEGFCEYLFSEGAGTVLTDSSGNSNNATLNNFTGTFWYTV